jgi:hypothetical protein
MASVLRCKSSRRSRRLSASATSSARLDRASISGMCSRCLRMLCSVSPYCAATRRFAVLLRTSSSLIRTLSGWLQTVQLRDNWNVLYRTHELTSSPHAHGHGEHEVVILSEPPAFEISRESPAPILWSSIIKRRRLDQLARRRACSLYPSPAPRPGWPRHTSRTSWRL